MPRSSHRLLAGLAAAALLALAPAAHAATTSQDFRVAASDGVELAATLSGQAPLTPRPTVVEFTPYGRGSANGVNVGPDYNYLLVQDRGTGDSDGVFDALGPRIQQDVADVLGWACKQPWSQGDLALNGFSASAITIYNSLHLPLPCVKAAILGSGTFELYRDLLYPGGISNLAPGLVVLTGIGGPAFQQGFDRMQRAPGTAPGVASGIAGSGLDVAQHMQLDDWWRERGFRGDVNHIPSLMITSFFDVESRGGFQGFQAMQDNPSHLLLVHGHDGNPAGTDGGAATARAWLDHFVRGIDNGIEQTPAVQMMLADGDRVAYSNGTFVRAESSTWPAAGTRWAALALDAARSGTAHTTNDGTLSLSRAAAATTQPYPTVPSLPNATDIPNIAAVSGGFNPYASQFPFATDMTLAEPLGLSYTTAPLKSDVLAAGPASLELRLAATTPKTGIWTVITDVWPDGTSHPVASGRLLTDYPSIDDQRSLHDPATGAVVQPYAVYDHTTPLTPGEARTYHVEFWPIGNRFKAGHRIRLDIVGVSAASQPTGTGAGLVTVGGPDGSRLLLPYLPGSDLPAALG